MSPGTNNMSVSATMKQFFDRAAVVAGVEKAQRAVMAQSGAYVMKTARNLIKSVGSRVEKINKNEKWTAEQKRKKIASAMKASQPGSPPKSRQGQLKELLFFAYDPSTGGLVVGPSKFNSKTSGYSVPQILEEGGDMPGTSLEPTGEWETVEGQHRQKTKVTSKKKSMAKRPYMKPAFDKSQPKLMKMWEDSVKRSNR